MNAGLGEEGNIDTLLLDKIELYRTIDMQFNFKFLGYILIRLILHSRK